MSYDVYWVKNRAEKITDFEHPTLRGALFINALYPGRVAFGCAACLSKKAQCSIVSAG